MGNDWHRNGCVAKQRLQHDRTRKEPGWAHETRPGAMHYVQHCILGWAQCVLRCSQERTIFGREQERQIQPLFRRDLLQATQDGPKEPDTTTPTNEAVSQDRYLQLSASANILSHSTVMPSCISTITTRASDGDV